MGGILTGFLFLVLLAAGSRRAGAQDGKGEMSRPALFFGAVPVPQPGFRARELSIPAPQPPQQNPMASLDGIVSRLASLKTQKGELEQTEKADPGLRSFLAPPGAIFSKAKE